ncbi:MFS transporter [Nocardia camponoti]|uniref:MFS transporter n=1 Tax=Nocardia camponoti TaxID=1616106 RepID=A0A917VAJ7_9NOCA|nr:MFS transporter [Nocardia camponoti]GGK56141.1 MFS transporter [Nocardia camponoti]
MSAKIESRFRAARVGVFAAFTLTGLVLAMWVVHIPAITDRARISSSELGMLILLLSAAAIVGMRGAGPAADRFGSRRVVAVAATWVSLSAIGIGFADSPLTLAIALAVFGVGNGALDVSMNTQAIYVERAYGRPIMAAFHAMFSAGGFAGALVGAATLRAGWSPELTLSCTAALGVAATIFLVPRLLRTEPDRANPTREPTLKPSPTEVNSATGRPVPDTAAPRDSSEPAAPDPCATTTPNVIDTKRPTDDPTRHAPQPHRRQVISLGIIAFILLLAEGVAGDWSALQVREHLNASDADAALAFGAFSATMTIGRFLADRVAARIGPVAMVRYGSLLCAAGFAVVICSPWIPLTLLGWAMCGLGLAGGVPQIFSAAGNLGGRTSSTDMSRVFTIGYLGLLAGPAIIGWLTAIIPLTAALLVPLVLSLACAAAAGTVGEQDHQALREKSTRRLVTPEPDDRSSN